MAIAILGPGTMGQGLAKLLLARGHEVWLGHPQADKAKSVAAKLGGRAHGGSPGEAAARADLVILACPFGSVGAALQAAGSLVGKVLVDITNPITADYMALTIGHITSAAEEVAKLAPGAIVVKAFNTVFSQVLPAEARHGQEPVQVFMAGDDASAKARVAAMVGEIDFEPVDAGPLANARYLEPVGEMNIHFGYALGWGTAIAPRWSKLNRAA